MGTFRAAACVVNENKKTEGTTKVKPSPSWGEMIEKSLYLKARRCQRANTVTLKHFVST